jgi:UPF0271 protein
MAKYRWHSVAFYYYVIGCKKYPISDQYFMKQQWEIDINCDVGEGVNNEAQLFPFISSCNLACGGHAGDTATMTMVTELAKKYGIKIGAHPSYPDRVNFGRKSMSIPSEELITTIRTQVEGLRTILKASGLPLHHIKAHGALYNDLSGNKELTQVYLESVTPYRSIARLYAPFGSVFAVEAARRGFQVVFEAFGDRNYNKDLSLVARSLPNALIEEPKAVLTHMLLMIQQEKVKAQDATLVPIKANTFCIHGDTPSAFEILTYLSQELPKHHVHLKK